MVFLPHVVRFVGSLAHHNMFLFAAFASVFAEEIHRCFFLLSQLSEGPRCGGRDRWDGRSGGCRDARVAGGFVD